MKSPDQLNAELFILQHITLALDQQIEQYGSAISEVHQLTTWCHPGVPSQVTDPLAYKPFPVF